ncbi:MAG: hypothetical protein H8E34_11095 [Bacteroidetes bacterium]|nr:hypothetical protein [Bacteroidota bacterium]
MGKVKKTIVEQLQYKHNKVKLLKVRVPEEWIDLVNTVATREKQEPDELWRVLIEPRIKRLKTEEKKNLQKEQN